MGFLSTINKFFRNESIENPSVPLSNIVNNPFGGRTKAGVSVNFKTAVALSSVFLCLRVLGESMASCRPKLYQSTDGIIREAVEHPHYQLIVKNPSPLYSPFTYVETMTMHSAGNGNGVANIIWGSDGYAKETRIIDSSIVNPVEYKDRVYYKIATAENVAYAAEDIIHLPAVSFNGIWGMSPITANREAIGAGIRNVDYMGSLMENGAFLQGYFRHPLTLGDDGKKGLQRDLKNRFSGSENAGETIVLEEGMEYVPLKLSPADLNWIATNKWTLEDVCRIFRIPLHLAQQLDRSTNNNIEVQDLGLVKHTLRPWAKRWEDELDRKLLTQEERQSGYFWRCNLDNFLRGDTKARGEFYKTLWSIGAITQNEIRKLENLNPVAGGDRLYVPLNMIDISELEKLNQDERKQVIQQYREKVLAGATS